jgi:hypothetical protein
MSPSMILALPTPSSSQLAAHRFCGRIGDTDTAIHLCTTGSTRVPRLWERGPLAHGWTFPATERESATTVEQITPEGMT